MLAVGDTLVAGLSGRMVGLNPLNGSVRWEAPIATPRGIKLELDGKRRVLSYVAGYRYQLDDKTSCP